MNGGKKKIIGEVYIWLYSMLQFIERVYINENYWESYGVLMEKIKD